MTTATASMPRPSPDGQAGNVSALGFGPVFQRMWNLYLAYSEAGFRAGYLDAHQLVPERGW
jgi:cyclopropane-fatty-acyl-phospholipid synthase